MGLIVIFETDGEDWQLYALCAQIGGDLWFPEDSCLGTEAKNICKRCPVAVECLEHAMDNNEKFGIWGGLSSSQRKLLARQRRREAG